MSYQATSWAAAQRTGGPALKVILLVLANYADENWECFPGQERIAEETEQGTRTVRRHLASMEEAGLIARVSRYRSDGTRTSDRYRLNPPLEANLAAGLAANPDTATGQFEHDYRPPSATQQPGESPGEQPAGKSKPGRKPKPLTEAPDTFEVTEALVAWASKEAPGVDVHRATPQWLDYHRAKGTTNRDWVASWRTWMRREKPTQQPQGRPRSRDQF